MSRITLKITPLDTFFFGTENVNPTDKDMKSNYYLKSSILPQQTTILGAARFALLLHSDASIFDNNHIKSKVEAKKLIGEKSFNLNDTVFRFGKIGALSAVFMLNKDIPYLPCPSFTKEANLQMIGGNPFLSDYDFKSSRLKQFTNGNEIINETQIFKEQTQISNRKDSLDKEDAFFKTQFYKLEKDWGFGIQIELGDGNLLPDRFYMKMGGENKLFCFEKVNCTLDEVAILKIFSNSSYPAIIAISDMLIPDYQLMDKCLFSIYQTKPFRYLQSDMDKTKHYTNRSKENHSGMIDSNLIDNIASGAIFYFTNEENRNDFISDISKYSYLQKTGFNQLISI